MGPCIVANCGKVPMNRIAAALYRFLVVYLSVAMVVTSIPLAPSTAYADDASALAVESGVQETDSGSEADADAVDDVSSTDGGSSSTTSDQTNNTQDDSSSAASDTPGTSLTQDLTGAATNSDAAKNLAATAKSTPSHTRTLRLISMPSLCRTAMCTRAMLAEALR